MSVPADITGPCGAIPYPYTTLFRSGLSGGCDIHGTSNGSTFTSTPSACGGDVTETWTATDVCGRTVASVHRTITVSPASVQTMTALADITIACGDLLPDTRMRIFNT